MSKFRCAGSPNCNATTRHPAKAGWQGGMFKLASMAPDSDKTPALAWLEFCPRCAALIDRVALNKGVQC
jgi:hypothetical protein